MVAEEWIVEERLVATFDQQRTKNFGRLRPQWGNAFFTSLAKEANVRRRLESHITDAKSDDFLNPCAGIEHRRKERVITTTISGGPINCCQHRLNLIEFEVLDRTGTRSCLKGTAKIRWHSSKWSGCSAAQ